MDEDAKTDGGGKASRGAKGMLGVLATMAAGGAAAFAVTWLDPMGGDDVADEHEEATGTPAPAPVLIMLDPLVVSLTGTDGARRRAPRLRVVIGLEVAAEHTPSPDDPRLRDGFTAAARGMGADALTGPGGLEALRAAFLARARDLLGEEAVSGVLVTDYVMT